MSELVDRARAELNAYRARTGMSIGALAAEMGYSRQTLSGFAYDCYAGGDGEPFARAVTDYIRAHPVKAPAKPGRLYPTSNVRMIDQMLGDARTEGAVTLGYGPPGTQKSFVFKFRLAESWEESLEPDLVLVYAPAGAAPTALLEKIALGLGAPRSNLPHRAVLMGSIQRTLM